MKYSLFGLLLIGSICANAGTLSGHYSVAEADNCNYAKLQLIPSFGMTSAHFGVFCVFLVRDEAPEEGIDQSLKIKGQISGQSIDGTIYPGLFYMANHAIRTGRGILYTEGDVSYGQRRRTQELNFVSGTRKYDNLVGGSLSLNGKIVSAINSRRFGMEKYEIDLDSEGLDF